MQTLDIECPSCGEMLELDAGFAGGVCRCSNCGTLMTVPSDAGKAESLTRPTSSTPMGSGGLDSMGVPNPGSRRGSRARGSKRGKKNKSKNSRVSTTVEAGEYRTASGKVIRLEESTRVPMAEGKRKKIQAATAAVFFSIIAVVVVAAVVVIMMVMSGPGGKGSSSDIAYDPAANPYTLDVANVVGLPVTDKTAVVIEASEYSEEWMSVVGDMVAVGLSQESGGEIALIGAGPSAIKFSISGMSDLPLDASEVRAWLGKFPAAGNIDVDGAIAKALESDPTTLIVIHGDADSSDIEAWDAALGDKEQLQLHTVHIGNSSPELEGWAAQRGGEAVVLSIDQIEYLKEAAAESDAQ